VHYFDSPQGVRWLANADKVGFEPILREHESAQREVDQAMGVEHYVRDDNAEDNENRDAGPGRVRRWISAINEFLFDKKPPTSAPNPRPYPGFNANGRRHS
jgi:hypothetical protein